MSSARQRHSWRADGSGEDADEERQRHHQHLDREERVAAACRGARPVRVPSAAPTRDLTAGELCDNDVGGEPVGYGGPSRWAGDEGGDRPSLGATHGAVLRAPTGDRVRHRGGSSGVGPTFGEVGVAGGAWGLASSGRSLGSSQRSSRRRVELRTPAEEEAVRKASGSTPFSRGAPEYMLYLLVGWDNLLSLLTVGSLPLLTQ